jgi:hypothetical protein
MARQLFVGGPVLDPPINSNPTATGAAGSALVATTAEALWLGSQFTLIRGNEPTAGSIFTLRAGGLMSTGASGTLILIPQYGALGGVSLGTSQTVTVPINLTSVPWWLDFTLVFRSIGAAGANSTCIGTGLFAAGSFAFTFGGTLASVDSTIDSAITISKTLSVAGSFTTEYCQLYN